MHSLKYFLNNPYPIPKWQDSRNKNISYYFICFTYFILIFLADWIPVILIESEKRHNIKTLEDILVMHVLCQIITTVRWNQFILGKSELNIAAT